MKENTEAAPKLLVRGVKKRADLVDIKPQTLEEELNEDKAYSLDRCEFSTAFCVLKLFFLRKLSTVLPDGTRLYHFDPPKPGNYLAVRPAALRKRLVGVMHAIQVTSTVTPYVLKLIGKLR